MFINKLNWFRHNTEFFFFFKYITFVWRHLAYLANPDHGNLVKIHRIYLIPGGDFFAEEFWIIQNVLKLPITKLAVTVIDIVKLNSRYISLSKYALAKTRSQSKEIKKNNMEIKATRLRHLKSKLSWTFPSSRCFSSRSIIRSISGFLCLSRRFHEQKWRSEANALNWTALHIMKYLSHLPTMSNHNN